MKFFRRILSIFRAGRYITVNDFPLRFTDLALLKIQEHIESRPAGVMSGFTVRVKFKNEKISYQAGFGDYGAHRITKYHYPVPLLISGEDEEILKGCSIDYHNEEKAFFVYPDIRIEVTDTPNPRIKKYYINRNVSSPGNEGTPYAITKDMPGKDGSNVPLLLRKIFATDKVESVYLFRNIIQIEFKDESTLDFEERVAEAILDYFENNGRPVKLQ